MNDLFSARVAAKAILLTGLLLSLTLGCGKKNDNSTDSSTSSSSTAVASEKKTDAKGSFPGHPHVNEALARDDLPAGVRKGLERMNKLKFPPQQRVVDALIGRALAEDRRKRFGTDEVDIDFEGIFKDTPPSYSSRGATGKPLDYSKVPRNCRDFNYKYVEFQGAATQRFREIHNDVSQEQLDAACRFIDRSLRFHIKRPTNAEVNELRQELDSLKVPQQIANDPWFRINRAYADFAVNKNFERSTKEATLAVAGFRETDYPTQSVWAGYSIFLALRATWFDLEEIIEKNAIRQSHIHHYADMIYYFMTQDFGIQGDQIRAVWHKFEGAHEFFNRYYSLGILEQLYPRLIEHPNTDPWLREMLRGKFHYYLAWKARGDGFASTVSEEGWQKFRENNKLAEKAFLKALEISPHCPESAYGLLQTGISGDTEQDSEYWFEKTLEIQPDYFPAITQYIHDSRPRWGGSLRQMMSIGERFARDGDYDTISPFAIIQAYVQANKDSHCLEEGPLHEQLSKRQMKLLHDCAVKLSRNEELHQHGHVMARDWLQSYALAFSYLMEDDLALMKDFQRLTGEFVKEAGYELNVRFDPDQLEREVLARTGPYAELFQELEEFSKLDPESLVAKKKQIRNLRAKASSDGAGDQIKVLFTRLINRTNYFEQFLSGQPVQLKFDKDFTDWRFTRRKFFEYDSEDSVIMAGDGSKLEKAITCMHTFPGPLTVEFDVQWLTPREELPTVPSAGFWPMTYENNYEIFCGINPKSGRLRYGIPEFAYWQKLLYGFGKPLEKMTSAKMRFNMSDRYFEFFVNDQLVSRNTGEKYVSVSFLSFGNPINHPGACRVRFSNIRVQKWNLPDLVVEETSPIDYFEAMTELYPNDPVQWSTLGKAVHQIQDYERANEHFEKARKLGDESEEVLFFLGDYQERIGSRNRAQQLYKQAATISDHLRFVGSSDLFHTDAASAAAEASHRYYWLEWTVEKEELDLFEPTDYVKPTSGWKWANLRLDAAKQAWRGDFEQARRRMERALAVAPDEVRDRLERQLESYTKEKRFYTDADLKPYYLEKLSFPHIRVETVDSTWVDPKKRK